MGDIEQMSFNGAQNLMSAIARKIEVRPWHRWFAWRPVIVHGKRVWLKFVYRRQVVNYVDMENWMYYEYGTLFDVIKD